jgi:RNA polymerase sigma-70 factor (ECF subfamily)
MNGPTDHAGPPEHSPAEHSTTEPRTDIDRAAVFERCRRRLFGMAYRMLGVAQDAEDLVQETYLRWHQADVAEVRSPEAWLLTVISRLSIDRLRHLSSERAAYTGNWLAEPIPSELAEDPAQLSERSDDLSLAFLRLLDRLGPEERAAFLLREVFELDYAAIAHSLGKSEAACRQLVHRAEQRVHSGKPRFRVAPEAHARLLDGFLNALKSGDQTALLGLLSADVISIGDGGGRVAASPHVLEGAARVAHLLLTVVRKFDASRPHRIASINGQPALVILGDGGVQCVRTIETDGEHIIGIYSVLNPDKLRSVTTA